MTSMQPVPSRSGARRGLPRDWCIRHAAEIDLSAGQRLRRRGAGSHVRRSHGGGARESGIHSGRTNSRSLLAMNRKDKGRGLQPSRSATGSESRVAVARGSNCAAGASSSSTTVILRPSLRMERRRGHVDPGTFDKDVPLVSVVDYPVIARPFKNGVANELARLSWLLPIF